MDKNSNSYVALFALIICVVCSASLAMTFGTLDPSIKANEAFDMQKNVLKATGLWDPKTEADKPRADLEQLFQDRVEQLLIDAATGEPITDKSEQEVRQILKDQGKIRSYGDRDYLSVYRVKDESGAVASYCFPTLAYGLWSWLEGFLALGPDCDTVVGITYYSHKETPGLGGEVDNPAWQESWQGKTIRDASGKLVSIQVIKGGASPDVEDHVKHGVDGLAGATITSNGVMNYMKANLLAFEPFMQKVRQ